jgi:Leucine-rich repeat (LRR) protein
MASPLNDLRTPDPSTVLATVLVFVGLLSVAVVTAPYWRRVYFERIAPPEAKALMKLGVRVYFDEDNLISEVEFADANVDDSALQHLAGVPSLRTLRLGPRCKGEGLHFLGNAANLENADFRFGQITDRDLQRISQWPRLEILHLSGRQITDKGVAYLRSLPRLVSLSLIDTSVTDAGLESLGKIQKLMELCLKGSPITGEGFSEFSRLEDLVDLDLTGTRITDTGMVALARCTSVCGMSLRDTSISGHGLRHLATLRQLNSLDLRGTKVRLEYVEPLISANPRLTVLTDSGRLSKRTTRGHH